MGKFYTIMQNNSGGYLMEDDEDGICEVLIVEATSPNEAEERVGKITEDYMEYCSCCGDRWFAWFDEADGDDVPSIYGKPVNEVKKGVFVERAFIHYLDGPIEEVRFA